MVSPLLSSQSPLSSSIPPNVTRLPSSVTDLVCCVSHEISVIENELATGKISPLLEDAIDDGFMVVDLGVLEQKLRAWHLLFSPLLHNHNNYDNKNERSDSYDYTVTPYFAVKCNSDPIIVEWLARTASTMNLPLGYDCASIAELELAKAQIQKYSLEETGDIYKTNNQNDDDDDDNRIFNKRNIPTTRIVYANPQRAEADLMRALELFATIKVNPEEESDDGSGSPSVCSSLSLSQQSREELWLTLDGVEEVYKIAAARKLFLEKHNALQIPKVRIVLRIWVPDEHSQVPLGEKFGMRMAEINNIVETCLKSDIIATDIIGISFHCGSGCSSVETYLEALEMGRKALLAIDNRLSQYYREEEEENQEKIQQKLPESQNQYKRHRCWLLDLGGGFPGKDGLDGDDGRFSAIAKEENATDLLKKTATAQATQTTVADIAIAVAPVLQSLTDNNNRDEDDDSLSLMLIAEPGRYFVEGAVALASRIYQKRQITTIHPATNNNDNPNDSSKIREYRIPHGVQGVFKDVKLCGESFIPMPLQIERQSNRRAPIAGSHGFPKPPRLYLSRVVGPSGDDIEDVVCESCLLPELDVGDWLVFDRMGAYTLSIASRAGRPVMRYVLGGQGRD